MKNIIKKRVLKIVATIVFAGLGAQHAISQDLDLEKDELEQLKHLEVYLPKQLSEDEVKIIIDTIVDDANFHKE